MFFVLNILVLFFVSTGVVGYKNISPMDPIIITPIVVDALINGILIFGAHQRNSTAILAWMILASVVDTISLGFKVFLVSIEGFAYFVGQIITVFLAKYAREEIANEDNAGEDAV